MSLFACCAAAPTGDLTSLVGPPTAAVVPAGQCSFGTEWAKAKLVGRDQVTHDVILLTFELADISKPLGLATCACILAKMDDPESSEPIVRPYTPVSTNAMVGKFQLCVKVYATGKMSNHLKELTTGESIEFKHIDKNVKIQYPFDKKQITMLVGGTGITPMIQALHAILGTADDSTQVTFIFGNKTQKDILCKDLLDSWAAGSGGRMKVMHVLSNADDDASWTGVKGFITKDLLAKEAPSPSSDHLVVVCGPPPMYNALCGPREKPEELTGVLKEMGFAVEQVYKF